MNPLLENVGIVVTWALCGVGAVTVYCAGVDHSLGRNRNRNDSGRT